jgi:hypothetical protein
MAPPFEDIVIVDLDVQKTTWSRVHSAMRTLYLRLNHDPDLAWNKFFFEERNSRVEVKRHGLWIEDGYIVFDCLLIDVDDHHLPDIRRSMTYANERSRELRAAQLEEREQLKAKARDEAEVLKALRANIREERPPAAPAVFEPDVAPEPDTAHSLEEAAHAQLEAAAQPESVDAAPVDAAIPDYEQRLRDFYAAFAPKTEAAPQASPPTAPLPAVIAPPESPPLVDEPIPQMAEPAPIEPDGQMTEPKLIAHESAAETDAAPVPEPTPASELDLESKRNDWRARFRAAFERNKN